MVFGDAHGFVAGAQGVFDFEVVFFGAKDNAGGGVFLWEPDLFVEEFEVEVHFTGIPGFECADFEVDGDEALEFAVEKEQIHVVGFVAEFEGVLVADEGKSVAEFEQADYSKWAYLGQSPCEEANRAQPGTSGVQPGASGCIVGRVWWKSKGLMGVDLREPS